MLMELKYSDKKIRDLVVFETGIVPVTVEIKRHEVILTLRRTHLDYHEITAEEIKTRLEPVIPRKITVVEV